MLWSGPKWSWRSALCAVMPLLVAAAGAWWDSIVAFGVAAAAFGAFLWCEFRPTREATPPIPTPPEAAGAHASKAASAPPDVPPAPPPAPSESVPPETDAGSALAAAHVRLRDLERFEAMARVAAQVAHDLNNALSPVMGYTEMLLAAPAHGSESEDHRKSLAIIHESALNAAAIVRRLVATTHMTHSGAIPDLRAGAHSAAVAATKPAQLRILVVEDDRAVRDMILHCLEADGHRVDPVGPDMDVVERFRRVPYDLVLLDGAFPDATGDSLPQTMKLLRPQVPVIQLTGSGMAGIRTAGVDLLLSKPMSLQDLRQAVLSVRIPPAGN